jgi:hypothetical protein
LLPSLRFFESVFDGTSLARDVRNFLKSITNSEVQSLNLHRSFSQITKQRSPLPSVSEILLMSGVTRCFRGASLLRLLKIMVRDFPALMDSLEKWADVADTIVCIGVPFRRVDSIPVPPDCLRRDMDEQWRRLKQRAAGEPMDVLRLLPLLETGEATGTVVGSREFTEFALRREIELVETEKWKPEWLITLNLSLKSHENLRRLMTAMVQETAHSMIGGLMAARIPHQNITPTRLLDCIVDQWRRCATAGIDVERFAFPIFCWVIDHIDSFSKSGQQLCKEFEKLHFDFEAIINQENRAAIHWISGELSILQAFVRRIPSVSCGKQFRMFAEMCQKIQAAADVLKEAEATADLAQILAWLVPADNAAAFLNAFVRACQIRLLTLETKGDDCRTQFTAVGQDGLSWLARLFAEVPEFVQSFHRAVNKPFS